MPRVSTRREEIREYTTLEQVQEARQDADLTGPDLRDLEQQESWLAKVDEAASRSDADRLVAIASWVGVKSRPGVVVAIRDRLAVLRLHGVAPDGPPGAIRDRTGSVVEDLEVTAETCPPFLRAMAGLAVAHSGRPRWRLSELALLDRLLRSHRPCAEALRGDPPLDLVDLAYRIEEATRRRSGMLTSLQHAVDAHRRAGRTPSRLPELPRAPATPEEIERAALSGFADLSRLLHAKATELGVVLEMRVVVRPAQLLPPGPRRDRGDAGDPMSTSACPQPQPLAPGAVLSVPLATEIARRLETALRLRGTTPRGLARRALGETRAGRWTRKLHTELSEKHRRPLLLDDVDEMLRAAELTLADLGIHLGEVPPAPTGMPTPADRPGTKDVPAVEVKPRRRRRAESETSG